ncbi:MAG TPA: hypothetical protein VFR67_15740 [Pilimelia sp.]|nr:hypothetical protein [Pilimelia sp.]
MRDRTSPPADFVEFVTRCAGRLHAAAWELTGDLQSASDLVEELLGATAQRWRRLRPMAENPASRATAIAYVGRLFRREAAAHGAGGNRPRRSRRPGHPAYDPTAVGEPAELAAAAWGRGRRARQTRVALAAGAVLLVILALVARPHPAATSDGAAVESSPSPTPAPSRVPPGLDVIPKPDDQLILPRLVTPLPARITLSQPVGPLTSHRISRAVAIFRLPSSPLLLLGDDGGIRWIPEKILAPVNVRGGGGEGRLPVGALSPDGSRIALPLTGELALFDVPTASVRKFPVPERTRSVVWFGNRWLLAGGPTSSVLIDMHSRRSTLSSADARTTLAPRGPGVVSGTPVLRDDPAASLAALGPSAGPLAMPGAVELLSIGEPATAPARVRRHLATPAGVVGMDIAVTGDLAGWIGPWQGTGFLTGEWAVRDCVPTGELPPWYGSATLAAAAVNPTSGQVHRLLVSTGSDGPAMVLGGVGPGTALVRPGAVLVRAPGEPGTVNLLAWQPGIGQLYLVATLDDEPSMAVADLSTFG